MFAGARTHGGRCSPQFLDAQRVGAVVYVQQRALGAFEQQVVAGQVGLVQRIAHVSHQWLQMLSRAQHLVQHGLQW
jgi:hypothetical protein